MFFEFFSSKKADVALPLNVGSLSFSNIFLTCPFNGKEKDYESGFHYYGARYYWSEVLTGWLSVDPMMDKYPSLSPYNYCAWNPIVHVDPDGRMVDDPPYNGSGWGHSVRRFIYKKMKLSNNITNIAGAGFNSVLQSDGVNVQGQALDKIKKDPAVVNLEREILNKVKSDMRYGKQDFSYNGQQGVQLGGKRAPGNMSDQFKDPLNPNYRDTWNVGFKELTWLARSVTIDYNISVTKDGAINISYHFSDIFDLRPSPGRSMEYNFITEILGFMYHDVLGGNDKMCVNASWKSSIPAKKTKKR